MLSAGDCSHLGRQTECETSPFNPPELFLCKITGLAAFLFRQAPASIIALLLCFVALYFVARLKIRSALLKCSVALFHCIIPLDAARDGLLAMFAVATAALQQ